jgi:broad specificity phosphatase PhoE
VNLYLVRHGESVSNAGLVTEGHGIYPLTDHGQDQARRFSETWGRAPMLIVTSKFTRAKQTSEPFRARYKESPTDIWDVQEFTQLSPDKYPGTTHAERMPKVNAYWKRNDPHFCDGPGAESFAGFIKRVGKMFDLAGMRLKAHLGEKFAPEIVVFTHGTFMQAALFSVLNGVPQTMEAMDRFHAYHHGLPIPNLAVMTFHFNKWREFEFGGAWSVGRMWHLGER